MNADSNSSKPRSGRLFLDLGMVALAILSIAILVYDEAGGPGPATRTALIQLDWAIVTIFIVEFSYRLWRSDDRRGFLKRNWWELPGMVPMAVGEAGFLRAFRLVRIVRIVRLVRVVAIIGRLKRFERVARKFASRSYVVQIVSISGMITIGSAFAVWLVERDVNAQFASFSTALWWAVVTATTVGYGDVVPITGVGRGFAVVLMILGIGLVGTLAATLSHAMLRQRPGLADGTTMELVDLVSRLERLAALRLNQGLTDEEFAAAKARVLEASS